MRHLRARRIPTLRVLVDQHARKQEASLLQSRDRGVRRVVIQHHREMALTPIFAERPLDLVVRQPQDRPEPFHDGQDRIHRRRHDEHLVADVVLRHDAPVPVVDGPPGRGHHDRAQAVFLRDQCVMLGGEELDLGQRERERGGADRDRRPRSLAAPSSKRTRMLDPPAPDHATRHAPKRTPHSGQTS